MINNFFNEFKANISFFKNKLLYVFKNLNYLVVFDLFCLFFIIEILFKLNILTFIMNFIFVFINFLLSINYTLILCLFILISVRNLILNKINGKSSFNNLTSNSNKLYLNMLFIIYSRLNLKSNVLFIVSYLNTLILSNTFSLNYFFNSTISYFKNLYWYPIFKRHSIFGYYRIARQNWVELKSEEVNYIKY